MSLERKLARWEEAGLIDGSTRERIRAFEKSERAPIALYAVGVLGAGTVALGVVALIAANWDGIPGSMRAELFLGRTRDFVFEIGGYDPRDLLRGHYLMFKLEVDPLPEREFCVDTPAGNCCLCLSRTEPDQLSAVERASCARARAECEAALPLDLLTRPYRYYVPEARAEDIGRRVSAAMLHHGARAVVAVDADGEGRVRELRIDGETIPGGVAR